MEQGRPAMRVPVELMRHEAVEILEQQAVKVPASKIIVAERSSRGVVRVRMGRTKDRSRSIVVAGKSARMAVETTNYLDGRSRLVATAGSPTKTLYSQESEVPFEAVPARTKDITDFGRLTTAARALAASMAEFGPDNEPSAEQLEVFVGGYRNILAWRAKVRAQMVQAEGQIDAVEHMLARIL